MSSLILCDGLTKRYGSHEVLSGIDLAIGASRTTVLTGPPESGKSVLLRLLVGLEQPDAGRLLIGGEDVAGKPGALRRIGYVPQSFALYPHMTVRDNIAYPMRVQGAPEADLRDRIDRACDLLNIRPLLDKTPDQLSGGEKQRTAVARGLVSDVEIFVLDDPLVGLDYKLRERLMDDLRQMRHDLDATFVYATADPLEALAMADDLVVLDGGRVVEAGPVDRVYDEPAHLRAAELVGFPRASRIDGRVEGGGARVSTPLFAIELDGAAEGAGAAVTVVRSEDVTIGAAPAPGALAVDGEVLLVEDLGAEIVVYVGAAGCQLTAAHPVAETGDPRFGEPIRAGIAPDRVMVFDAATGRRLGRGRAVPHG